VKVVSLWTKPITLGVVNFPHKRLTLGGVGWGGGAEDGPLIKLKQKDGKIDFFKIGEDKIFESLFGSIIKMKSQNLSPFEVV
jgi:hypothetical protein